MKAFPHITVSGTAIERGKQMGQLAKQQIVQNIEMYRQYFHDVYDVAWDAARDYATSYIPWIEQYDQEIMDEIKGMSEGANLDLLDLVVLNARSEVIINIGKSHSVLDGCTCLAATPVVTKEEVTLLGQNWDWNHRIQPGMIIAEIEQPPKPTILMVTEAGIVGKIGLNSAGLGLCMNFLGTSEIGEGVPIHIVLRGILNSNTLPKAVGQITRLPRGTSANYLIAHKEGETVDVEATPTNYDVIYPLDGYLTHTNHFVAPRMLSVDDTKRVGIPDTHLRQGVATRLLKAQTGSIEAGIFKQIFTNHAGHPVGICRHGEVLSNDGEGSDTAKTVFSIIMNLAEGRFELTTGNPCESAYQTYRLK
ncbi:MAG: acyl-CoA--6-aminopenicillanic acid acyl-transferase [Brevibacillus sp.]|jgi:isopenicillin-N N-acyltransferase-like protein|nr:acyl-CoA--6-aminopenicillanic acid acyl-transferase [Brevibacillus sp.]